MKKNISTLLLLVIIALHCNAADSIPKQNIESVIIETENHTKIFLSPTFFDGIPKIGTTIALGIVFVPSCNIEPEQNEYTVIGYKYQK